MNRHQLSHKYLNFDQLGLEIAGLHFPWPMVHGNTKAIQMDLLSKEDLYWDYPEHKNQKLVTVHILDDGNYCKTVPTESMDFVCSSHVLEHCENTVEALRNWLRVCKKGGHVLMAVPLKDNFIDRNRDVTHINHFVTEFKNPYLVESVNRAAHYSEYYRIVDKLNGDLLTQRVKESLQMKPRHPHIHWHTFTQESLKQLLALYSIPKENGFDVLEYIHAGHEMLVVLQKTREGDLVWP